MLKARESIDPAYKWDLSSLYWSDQEWESDFKLAQTIFDKIIKMKGNILKNVDSLLAAVETYLEGSLLMSRIGTYSKMKQDENTKNSHYQALNARAEALNVQFGEISSYFVPELMAGDPDQIEAFLGTDQLKKYDHYLKDILRYRPHTLGEEAEAILAQAGDILSTPMNTFGMLNGADLKFPNVKDEKGEAIELTHSSFVPLLMSSDRTIRRSAYKKYYKVFEDHKNTFAMLLASEVKKNIFNAKSRKHTSARAAALFTNNVPESVYDNLIVAVNDNLDALHRYMKLRKKLLNVNELKPYDLYVPLISGVDMKIPYEKAQETVLGSLKYLGKDYCARVEESYHDGWIDVYENIGKRSGAYSWGMYTSKPYILLNYQEKLNDLFTLSHELGHSMHSYYTRQTQAYVYGDYSIFVAEVASTTNEALLNKHLLDTVTDKKEKLYLLNNYLENYRGTVFRQTMFAEFERDIHAYVEAGNGLTSEKLSEIYRGLNKKYYGSTLVLDEQLDLEWARIPHFYYNFYVFQYATGFACAATLANKIVSQGDSALQDYLNFLRAGSSVYPIEVLKKAGVDMTTPEPVNDALKVFRDLVNEMATLV